MSWLARRWLPLAVLLAAGATLAERRGLDVGSGDGTVDAQQARRIAGTGAVWHHGWHGRFIEMEHA